MNATQDRKKQIGDRVRITAGQHKDKVGEITGKERRGWTLTLDDGAQATVPFPMVVLIESDTAEPTDAAAIEPTETADSAATAEDNVASEAAAESDTRQAHQKRSPSKATQLDASGSGETGEATTEVSQMTVRELWALAKQRSVSIARTKADFYRIIKAMNPDEDLALLKGKALFDRVKELHISRLRSKEEMARLLSAS